jgi:hypothetical protein
VSTAAPVAQATAKVVILARLLKIENTISSLHGCECVHYRFVFLFLPLPFFKELGEITCMKFVARDVPPQ